MKLPDWFRHTLLGVELTVGVMIGFSGATWAFVDVNTHATGPTSLDDLTMGLMLLFSGALFLHAWRRSLPARLCLGCSSSSWLSSRPSTTVTESGTLSGELPLLC
jgi:hypothetical protein